MIFGVDVSSQISLIPFILTFSLLANSAQENKLSANLNEMTSENSVNKSAIFFGHNLTTTSDVLKKDSCSLGIQVAACGVTNQVTLGTSPWILSDYNLTNLFARVEFEKDRTLQVGYFNSCFSKQKCEFQHYDGTISYLPYYQMEAYWLNFLTKTAIHNNFNLYTNLSLQYYADDTRPFSLRRTFALVTCKAIWGFP